MDAICCDRLSKRFGAVQALDSLDLAVPGGAIFGFLGRNGAGKTTTIRLLAGLARPTSGRAWIAGVEVTQTAGAARRLFGYLPQDPSFYNWMTAREYLDYVARLFGMGSAERRQRVDEMLELADLTSAANRRIGGFSGGMRQRLGIAQALIHRPPVLLLDEPTSSLDPVGRRDILEFIASLRGQTTVFFSTHILADVERICDTIGIIHEGRLVLAADRDELLARYATSVMTLEIEPECADAIEAFIAHLKAQAWVAEVTRHDTLVRITARDVARAKRAVWPLVTEHNLALARYEWARPSLEEIFISASDPTGFKNLSGLG